MVTAAAEPSDVTLTIEEANTMTVALLMAKQKRLVRSDRGRNQQELNTETEKSKMQMIQIVLQSLKTFLT